MSLFHQVNDPIALSLDEPVKFRNDIAVITRSTLYVSGVGFPLANGATVRKRQRPHRLRWLGVPVVAFGLLAAALGIGFSGDSTVDWSIWASLPGLLVAARGLMLYFMWASHFQIWWTDSDGGQHLIFESDDEGPAKRIMWEVHKANPKAVRGTASL